MKFSTRMLLLDERSPISPVSLAPNPVAPGTFGSIFAWVVFILISHFINMLVLTIASLFFAIWICEKVTKDLIEKDHKSIVVVVISTSVGAAIPVTPEPKLPNM